MSSKSRILSLIPLCFLAACSTYPGLDKVSKRMEKGSPAQKAYFEVDKSTSEDGGEESLPSSDPGSLWQDTYSSHLYNNLYRASKVGDTVMIVISEESQGVGTGNTKADKKVEDTRSVSGVAGLFQKLDKLITGFSDAAITGKTDSKFQGKGSTDRSGKLFAKLSARVTKVMRNGNMAIRGEQHIKLNKEEQVIVLEGLIRPYDILPNNTVSSSAIADARISYSGFGVVADRQSPGWLVRVLDKVWPF